MTREESIKEITNHLNHWKRLKEGKICSEADGENAINAFEMAINALEQQPCEEKPNRSGEWKEVYAETDYRNGWIEFSCENCEYQHGLENGQYDWSYGEPIPWNYCPICGARMGGDTE